jgi:hypothetical protein
MTGAKKPTAGKRGIKKLKVKKETIRDLDPRSKGNGIKGGAVTGKVTVTCFEKTCLLCR